MDEETTKSLFMGALQPGEEDKIVVYELRRERIKTIHDVMDLLEFSLGSLVLEKGGAEEAFLNHPMSRHYDKVDAINATEKEEDESQSGA